MKPRYAVVVGVALCLPASLYAQAQEATVLFKDGFYLSGKVIEQRDFLLDPHSKVQFQIPSAKGFMYLDDEVRRVIFTPTQVQEVVKKKLWTDLISLTRYKPRFAGDEVLPTWLIQKFGAFDAKWERSVAVGTFGGTKQLLMDQRITQLTPRHTRVDTVKYNWPNFYMTSELGPENVRTLLYQFYSDSKNTKGVEVKDAAKRLYVAQFMHQGGWFDLADKELAGLIENHPEVKKEAEEIRDKLKADRVQRMADDIERASKVGQHQVAQEQMRIFFKNGHDKFAANKTLLDLQDLKRKYEEVQEQLKEASLYLKELPKLVEPKSRDFWVQAADTILGEMSQDNMPRLESFRKYGKQHVDEIQAKQKPSQAVEEVLALAISGWLLGDVLAEPDPKMAQLLWKARLAVLEIQRTDQPGKRQQMALALAQEKELTAELLARVIRQMPPPVPAAFGKKDSGEVMTMNFDADGRAAKYLVQLPPDYDPLRPTPVVMILHGAREKPDDLLARWSDEAAKHGYILAAPLWGGVKGQYEFTAREHALVLDCLRDMRRRFQVDSERVFLFGWEQGAEMAYDVGLSHPDQFAGVLPMCGAPKFFPTRCWSNAQYLPLYIVEGDRNNANPKFHRALLKNWITYHYPCLYVEYKGRLSEWYEAELPVMFDWMNRKKRANPTREVGRFHTGGGAGGEEFKTMRQGNSRFYWLSTDGIHDRHVNDAYTWSNLVIPATMQATIITGNQQDAKTGAKIWQQFNVRTTGLKSISIWLSPQMIDFTKPVLVRLNNAGGGVPKLIPPSLPVMLEDFYQNGDRQRLYFARIDIR